MLDDGGGGLGLEVRGIAILAEDAFDGGAHFGADAVFDGPVDGGVGADGFEEFVGDEGELFVAEDFDGALVFGEGVVEGEFFGGEAELFAALVGVAHVVGEFDQLGDDLGAGDGAALVAIEGGIHEGGEGARLHRVGVRTGADFVVEQLLQEFEGEILLGQVLEAGQKIIGEDGDVGRFEAGGVEDVD